MPDESAATPAPIDIPPSEVSVDDSGRVVIENSELAAFVREYEVRQKEEGMLIFVPVGRINFFCR